MDKLLTIGVPTYERRLSVRERVEEYLSSGLTNEVSLWVVDNDSTDGTYEELHRDFSGKIKLLRQKSNLGFARNFLSLFENCETPYLMISSDEDRVNYENVRNFLSFLQEYGPTAVSPQFIIQNEIYRGETGIRNILPTEYRLASNYISGLTFKISDTTDSILHILKLIDEESHAAVVYPQVLLFLELTLKGNCFWFDQVLGVKKDQLTSHITTKNGKYFNLPGRWEEYKSFYSYFDQLSKRFPEYGQKIATIRDIHMMSLFHLFRTSVLHECPEFEEAFRREAASRLDLSELNPLHRVFVRMVYKPWSEIKKAAERLYVRS